MCAEPLGKSRRRCGRVLALHDGREFVERDGDEEVHDEEHLCEPSACERTRACAYVSELCASVGVRARACVCACVCARVDT